MQIEPLFLNSDWVLARDAYDQKSNSIDGSMTRKSAPRAFDLAWTKTNTWSTLAWRHFPSEKEAIEYLATHREMMINAVED